ncbi:MAG: nitrite/sulfite reductase, partial [Betaproteobacteria bacterium]|nr:nitrite/sulfite reductase [Betaproteobacteria bacterium]
LISQGVSELLGGQKFDDLAQQSEELRRVLPTRPHLSRQLAKFAEDFASPAGELSDARLTEWFSELDSWTMEAAEFCLGFDHQLDLAGALPLKASAQSSLSQRTQPSITV